MTDFTTGVPMPGHCETPLPINQVFRRQTPQGFEPGPATERRFHRCRKGIWTIWLRGGFVTVVMAEKSLPQSGTNQNAKDLGRVEAQAVKILRYSFTRRLNVFQRIHFGFHSSPFRKPGVQLSRTRRLSIRRIVLSLVDSR